MTEYGPRERLFVDGNEQVRVDVSQNTGYTIVASIDSKGHIQLPQGYAVLPSKVNPFEPHDLDLVVTDMNATPSPTIKCKGGVDARPPAKYLAKVITERDNAVHEMRMAESRRETAERIRDDYKDHNKKLKQEVERLQQSLENEQAQNLTARVRDSEVSMLYARNSELESKLADMQRNLDDIDHNWTKAGIKRLMNERDTAVGRADESGGKLNDIANILER